MFRPGELEGWGVGLIGLVQWTTCPHRTKRQAIRSNQEDGLRMCF